MQWARSIWPSRPASDLRFISLVAWGLGCSGGGETAPPVRIATQLVLLTPAAGAASGAAFVTQPVIAIRDASNQTVTTDNGSLVTMAVTTGATVVGTATVQALAGVANFTNAGISGTAATAYTLTFSRSGLVSATQQVSLAPGTSTQLVLVTAAAGGASGAAFATQPVVAIRDASGNTQTADNSSIVTVTASSGATIIGTASATAIGGVATFVNVGVAAIAGTSYVLSYARSGLTTATQTIVPAPGAVAAVTVAPSSAIISVAQTRQLTATLTDAQGNNVPNAAVQWSSSNALVASVSASGLVSGVGSGTAVVSATSNGRVGTASIAVQALTLAGVTAGSAHSCGFTSAGDVYCWGRNDSGQLGDSTTVTRLTAVASKKGFLQQGIELLTAGSAHTCGYDANALSFCWGDNTAGQLMDGTTISRTGPVQGHPDPNGPNLSAGSRHTCFRHFFAKTTEVNCWGSNASGQLGNGTTANGLATVQGLPSDFFGTITGGASHTCARTASSVAYCWGSNNAGQLGDGTTSSRLTAVVVQTGLSFASLTAGSAFTCGLTATGVAWCWGANESGQLGDGSTTNRANPTQVQGGFVFVALTAGPDRAHTCGRVSSGVTYCWGLNDHGQLGDGTTINRSVPVPVQGGLAFTALAAGWAQTCGLTRTGATYCWGSNSNGQLGDGTTTQRLLPVAVNR